MPSPPRVAPTLDQQLGAQGSSISPPASNTFYLKIIAKKDSTETMVKSLISRTHVPKPIAYTLRHNEKNSECFLQYHSTEVIQEVQSKISGEKINGAAFDTELLEVEPQTDDDEDETPSPQNEKQRVNNDSSFAPNLSQDAIRSISEMLKQIPKRKQVTLNISPRNKQKRHQKMKNASKSKRKPKKLSTSSDSDFSSPNHDIDENLLNRVKNILAQEPIAAASQTNGKTKAFDPYSGIPSKPSKVLKDKTRNLLKTIQISSYEEEQHDSRDRIATLLDIVLKNQKKHSKKKKKKRSISSFDSSDSSSSESSSSSSSSDESPSKIRRKLKKLQKKGKLKSGRHRKGLAVIRNEIWPHDGINARLAGKSFPTVESLSQMAFIAGILNPILDSDEFKKLEKKKIAPKMRQKLIVLNELAHGIIRSQNFPEVRDFYLSTLEEIETGQGSWKDQDYWMTQMVLLRTVLRSVTPAQQPLGGVRRNMDNPGLQPRDCCYQFNNDGCSKDSPHPNNDPARLPETVHHYCKICLRKNLKKVHAAKACKEGSGGQ